MKQSFDFLDTESGHVYSMETLNDELSRDTKLILPEKDGTVALVSDVKQLEDNLKAGDVVVKEAKVLDGKNLSELALSDLSNVSMPAAIVEALRGYTGSKGADGIQGIDGKDGPQGPVGIQGPTGYNGSTGYTGSIGYTGSAGTNGTVSTAAPSGGVNGDTWFQY